jgi:cyclophilin family peptidyl-prolyl cis-trans isomerase
MIDPRRVLLLTLLATNTLFVLGADAPAPAAPKSPAPAAGNVQVVLTLRQETYEIGGPVRAELVLANTSPKWIAIPDVSDIVKGLRLIPPGGAEVEPTKPEQFGAARTTQLGPGGFVGVTFDATMLFPVLGKEGQYKLVFRGPVGAPREASLRMIPAFDPSRKYTLAFTTPDGEAAIELYPKEAPVSVHNLVNLARIGFFEGASILRMEPGVMLAIHGPVTPAHRIVPFERTTTPHLAGTVLLEAAGQDKERASYPNLIVLLAPQPATQGRYTVVGQIVSGLDNLQKLASRPTSGKDGAPPFHPLTPASISHAVIREQPTASAKP